MRRAGAVLGHPLKGFFFVLQVQGRAGVGWVEGYRAGGVRTIWASPFRPCQCSPQPTPALCLARQLGCGPHHLLSPAHHCAQQPRWPCLLCPEQCPGHPAGSQPRATPLPHVGGMLEGRGASGSQTLCPCGGWSLAHTPPKGERGAELGLVVCCKPPIATFLLPTCSQR